MSFFIIFVSYVAMYIRLHNGSSLNRENQQCKRQGKKAHVHSFYRYDFVYVESASSDSFYHGQFIFL